MRAVLLTGGSEIIATSLFEELAQEGIPLAVISLGINSLLRDASPECLYARIEWPPKNAELTAHLLGNQLRDWGASGNDPWCILPTEDGGLRLLMENRKELSEFCVFSHARNLRMGGLDKSELFAFLAGNGCADVIPETIAVETPDQALQEVLKMGGDCIIKPSLKPYSMDLSALGAKAIATRDHQERASLEFALRRAWPTAAEWIVQERLDTPEPGELVFWALRDVQGNVSGVSAVERWKYPRVGGSGCWVETIDDVDNELFGKAERVLHSIDYFGLCEIPFLKDPQGRLRILELNPRPWLQVGLPAAAGYPMGVDLVRVLGGNAAINTPTRSRTTWVNVERMLAAALSGQQGRRLEAILLAMKSILTAHTVAIYSTRLRRVRLRWLTRMFNRLWR